ncbi:Protein SRG1 [Platanthera guangdongensis]|uniref:Protein SRG1 n=1 Tax=Platanthera guangdongensis TaxID=2320717 RepID=A0ABR2LJI6_9ASPA
MSSQHLLKIVPSAQRATLEEYARHTREISVKLLNAIGDSLGLEESYMEKMLDLTNGHQIVVGNRYPPIQSSEPAIGLPPHSDTPLLTLLLQHGAVDGLEVFHNGHYVPVRIMPDTLLAHAGDLLEIVSNGKYKSVLHRVMLKGESTRMSIVTALGSSIHTMISPAQKLVEIAENVAAYRSMSYLEFVEITKRNHAPPRLSGIEPSPETTRGQRDGGRALLRRWFGDHPSPAAAGGKTEQKLCFSGAVGAAFSGGTSTFPHREKSSRWVNPSPAPPPGAGRG